MVTLYGGDGDGYGYGYGDGSGDGYGDGYGYGYGDGSGDGSGDGYPDYWRDAIPVYLATLPRAIQERTTALVATGATLAYWRSDAAGRPANGGQGSPAEPGLRQSVSGPLAICTAQALHASYCPNEWQGERLWLVALMGEVQQVDNKLAALEREIISEITSS